MVNLLTLITKLPRGSEAYVFGSSLHSASPRDLDILIVYDTKFCAPRDAYAAHEDFIVALRQVSKLDIDLTLLTREEEQGSRFFEKTGALRFSEALETSSVQLGTIEARKRVAFWPLSDAR